ncbi:tripartite motif-containing protein 3-like [Xiphophorus maculatus]|uniref:Si:ch73-335l21.4 n=1 Tax=Xiphophorus maculatus TaxID=8083 RepID=A0A3B5QCV1_XIPMA|nr:tripartite motif-containing protein 3-like [Xiphophorus maculatus]
MISEIECGVCYRTYNAARRCPRELHCKHTFCESCLRALSRPLLPGADRSVDCPLCRHSTPLTAEGNIRTELRVDESALERLMTAGVLDREEDPDDEEEEDREEGGEAPECEREVPEAEAEESDSSAGLRGGRLRRSWTKVWRKISGKSSQQRPNDCMTTDDLRNMAMMSCHMF